MADENGFEWLSVWDHFYPALTDPTGTCFEAVSIMTRAPFDWESYELFIDRVLPAFR